MIIAINLAILIGLIVVGLPVPFCFMTAAIYGHSLRLQLLIPSPERLLRP